MKERLVYIDKIKGIAIFFVVFEHLIQQNTKESVSHVLYGYLYPFLMPLFMFVSGYIGYRTYKIFSLKSSLIALLNKALILLLPYLVWSFIEKDVFFDEKIFVNIHNEIYNLFTKWNRLWFLWYLFNIYVFYSFYLVLVSDKGQKSLFVDLFSLSIFLLWGVIVNYFNLRYYIDINPFLSLGAFFFVGVIISKNSFLREIIKSQFTLFLSFVVFLLLIGHYQYLSESRENKLIKIVVSFAAIVVIYNLSQSDVKVKIVDRLLERYGKNSLIIYVMHFFMVKMFLDGFFLPTLGLYYTFLFFCLNSFIIIEMCLVIKKIISISPHLNLLLFGEKIRKSS